MQTPEDVTESQIEQRLVLACNTQGWACLKLHLAGRRGWPDRTILLPDAGCVFVEVKKPGGRLSRQQVQTHADLRSLGQEVVVVWNFAEVDRLVLRLQHEIVSSARPTT